MTMKRVDQPTEVQTPPPVELQNMPADLKNSVKFSGGVSDEDLNSAAALRHNSEPWKSRGETAEQSMEALTKLRPFIQVAKLTQQVVGYVTVERDGPVPGAAYMRNIVVKPEA